MLPRSAQLLVELGCVGGLGQNLGCTACLCSILVGWAGNLLPRAYDVTIAARSKVFTRQVDHGQRSKGCREQAWWVSFKTVTVVDDLALWQRCQSIAAGFGSGGFPSLRCARPLFARSVFFGKSLLAGFCLPVVVPDTTSVFDQPCSELSEHGSCRNNSNLARSVRVRQNLLLNEIVFLLLVGNDLE